MNISVSKPTASGSNSLWIADPLHRPDQQPASAPMSARRIPIDFDAESTEASPGSRLRQCFQFEGLLVDILARFVNLPAGEVQREIGEALSRVCGFIELDRACLWHNSPDTASFVLTHESIPADGDVGSLGEPAPIRQLAQGIESKAFCPWITAQAKRGKTVAFGTLSDLPAEAAQDLASLTQAGTRAGVFIPFLVRGEVLGAVSFDKVTVEKRWSELEIRRLEFVAEVFAQAIARNLSEEAVRASEALLALAAASTGAALWSLDLKTRQFQISDKAYELLRLAPGSVLSYEQLLEMVHPEDRARVQQTTDQAIHSRGEIDVEFRVVLGGGETFWVTTRGRCQCGPAGAPERLMGASVNSTEKKAAQEELAKSYAEIKQLKDRLQAESDYLREEIKVSHAHGEILGCSKTIRRVLHSVEQVAPADCAVLITGETGTGKELIAQHIHRLSKRKDRIMVLVNCAALPSALVESELFGRERGAYTGALTSQVGRFEVANGSTIFLDEIGELSLEVQAKLLRVLQQGEFQRLGSPKTHKVDVRVIAATNRDLAEEVRKGRFREDLYYRLRVFPVDVPALRDRVEDIPMLVFAFMEEFATRMGKKITKVPRKVMEVLEGHAWPGNIRELRNVVEHSVILTAGDTLKLTVLGERTVRESQPVTLAEVEREHILKTLESTGWRIKGRYGAAARLALQPSTLYSRMQKLGIPHRRQKEEGNGQPPISPGGDTSQRDGIPTYGL